VMRDALVFAREKPRSVAVVGMGGGALPRWFRVTSPGVVIDAIEYDPAVIAAAHAFFGVLEDKRLRVHQGDGREVLRQLAGPYDVIILDAFGAEDYPPHLVTAEFFAEVRGKLAPGGVVLANLLGRSHNPRYVDMLGTFLAVFPAVAVAPVPGRDQVVVIARTDREAHWSAMPGVRPITTHALGQVNVLRDSL
jgi:spermidine synthase